jgi:hypothetical protein
VTSIRHVVTNVIRGDNITYLGSTPGPDDIPLLVHT